MRCNWLDEPDMRTAIIMGNYRNIMITAKMNAVSKDRDYNSNRLINPEPIYRNKNVEYGLR